MQPSKLRTQPGLVTLEDPFEGAEAESTQSGPSRTARAVAAVFELSLVGALFVAAEAGRLCASIVDAHSHRSPGSCDA